MANPIIPLEGGHNFRDIGGYATQTGNQTLPGLVYRSGALSQLSPAGHATLHGLGIRTVFDLREEREYATEGADQLNNGIKLITAPTTIGNSEIIHKLQTDPLNFRMSEFYVSSLAPRAAYHAGLFGQIVAHLDQPVVIHCSAGKDRTGIMIALLLRLAGVRDDIIVDDYAATAGYLGDYEERQRRVFEGFGLPTATIDELLGAKATNIASMLTHLDKTFGSAEAYLLQGGATSAQIDTFLARFVG